MAIEKIETEGDFVIRNGMGNAAFRFHADGDSFAVTATQNTILITDGEAKELIGWLKRRFEEPVT